MSGLLCCGYNCGKLFSDQAGDYWVKCEHCGMRNRRDLARGRVLKQRAAACVAPTPDPNMGSASTKPVADSSLTGRKIGKVRMDLVMQDMPRAIEALARVMTWAMDEKGYKESDWLTVPDGERKYHAGLHRHDNKECRGQEFDEESNLEHAIHTAWNAMARVELILRRKEQA